ncbi:hypothetical protein [Lewinella sp. LCG006]|uniref:hypothetical protein n=1 Tax=Lewinella sp. LCG006 TaxID=3231911 RepID=UPI003460F2FF
MPRTIFKRFIFIFVGTINTLLITPIVAQTPDSAFYELSLAPHPLKYTFDSRTSLLSGTFTQYYENGQMKAQGELANGWRLGTWKVWKENGELFHQRTYTHPWNYVVDYPKAPKKGPAALFNTPAPLKRQDDLIPYPWVHESEIYWEKRLWFDLSLADNPLLFADDLLFKALDAAILEQSTTVAYSGTDDRFRVKLEQEEALQTLRDQKTNIVGFRLKTVWFFSNSTQLLDRRIIGLAPLVKTEEDTSQPLMWFYYPEIRQALQKVPVQSPNPLFPIKHLEDLFHYWEFNGLIIKESNVHDRAIRDYLNGEAALKAEHQRILLSIYGFEHKAWIFFNQGESVFTEH